MLQTSIDDLGEHLHSVTFVVVDLETTGGSPKDSAITEIGAVKVRGGEVLGEFASLVNPGMPIPPFITVLTGISDAMVADAPEIGAVLPMFLDWAAGAVLVAHNAPFDLGFLKAACAKLDRPWPPARTLDTVPLARRVLSGGEVANCKLGTLAAFFRTTTDPNHRALSDARATVGVMYGLFERLGAEGVDTLEEVTAYLRTVNPERRAKRHLARGLPHAPGVYVFRDADDLPLYVGTSSDVASRVSSYFTAAETRTRMTSMIRLAQRVEVVECAHPLEAEIRELRIIAAQQPAYNKRSKYPRKAPRPVKDLDSSVEQLLARIDRLAAAQRFEEALAARNKLATLLRGATRLARLHSLTRIEELVAARPVPANAGLSWEISIIRWGRLAAAGLSAAGEHPLGTLDTLRGTAETVQTGTETLVAETELLHGWLERPETRLVTTTAGWSYQAHGAGRWGPLLVKAMAGRAA